MKDIDLNTSPDLPSSDSGLGDGTSGATPAEQKRGWLADKPAVDEQKFNPVPWGAPEPDPGFLNRPAGMER